MLHDFLTSNRQELIARCRAKVAKRFSPTDVPAAVDHGVPLFLQQLVETLRIDEGIPRQDSVEPTPVSASTGIGRAAALHGAELLRLGYTIDQVVHDYGDVCQSITDLAGELEMGIATDEFRTLNACLDNAIAGAVTSFGLTRQALLNGQAETLQQRLSYFSDEQRRLVDIAIQAFAAIRTGNVGLTGATGGLLVHALDDLHSLAERVLPEIRLASTNSAETPV